jgi:hypothetical protein
MMQRRNLLPPAYRFLLPGIALLLGAAGPSRALTEILLVTPEYLGEHPKELSLQVSRREDGLLAFTIERTVPERRHFTARLLVKREGKTVADTTLPSLGQKDANTFAFAISREMLAESEFRLDESSPAHPRTRVGYQFRLREHVPAELK